MKKRILVMLLATALMAGMIPMAVAADGAQNMANAALNYLEKVSGPDLGFGSENWCGYFLYRCAENAGETVALGGSSAIMASTNSSMKWFVNNAAAVGCFYQAIIDTDRYGFNNTHLTSKSNYSPAVGDIIYYDWDGNPNGMGHMEVITSVSGRQITTVGGSTGSSCSGWKGVLHVHKHTYDVSSSYVVAYARPNYSGSSTSTKPDSTLSISPTSEPGEHRDVGAPFYFRGSITSNYPITYVTMQIRGEDKNTILYEKVIRPEKTHVDILNDGLDSFKFGSLSEGNYYLWLFAGDSSGMETNWCVHFSVGYPAEATPEPPAPQPTALTKSMFTVDTSAVTHTGSPINKTITSDLAPDTDYTVTYTDNTAVGTAKITITGIGDYTGTLEYTFTIKAKSTGGSSSGGSSSGGGSSKPSTPGKPVKPEKPVTPASEKFTDVVKGSWYEDGVTYVTNKGLFQGMSEGVFAPNTNMTRSMLMTVLARLDGQDTEGGETWYSKGMDWAKEQGVSDGAQPNANVTREQLVVMLYRYAKSPAAEGDLSGCVDGHSVSNWAKDAMVWAVANGILTGKDGQRLDPQGTATRGEVAAVIQRFVVKLEK